jgi:hypothetical protein
MRFSSVDHVANLRSKAIVCLLVIGPDCETLVSAARRDAIGTGAGEIHVPLPIIASICGLFIGTTMITRRDKYWNIQEHRGYFAENTDQGFYQGTSQAVHDPATTAVSISWGSPEKEWSLGQRQWSRQVPLRRQPRYRA